MPRALVLCLLVLTASLVGCGDREVASTTPLPPAPLPPGPPAYEIAASETLPAVKPQEWPDLHNVFRLSEAIVSGSEPHGEEALKRLSEMGVRTILSVDGKAPDVETAKRYGMRYVHVPIQYSGITASERVKITKTFREMEGPFYVHCFHGVHRGPAAAALGRVVLDGMSREHALAEMRQYCGTSAKYQGLYETVGRAELPSPTETEIYAWDFPPAHTFEGFRQAMVEVSRPFDHLKALSKRDWKADPEHPDLHAANEARKMLEVLEATVALDDVKAKPEDFQRWLRESLEHARTLDGAFQDLASGTGGADAVQAAFGEVDARCSACHQAYRNH